MKIKISNFKVKENKLNEVTSPKIFKPRRVKDKDGNWRFHDEGIFSRVIFGSVGRCSCGKNETPGTWCDFCGERVVAIDNMPDFYISCGVLCPFVHNDYSIFGKNSKNVKNLLEYKAFLYDGEVVEFDLEKINIQDYPDQSKLYIGAEAAKMIDDRVTDEWIDNNSSSNVPVPHVIHREIIQTSSGSNIIGEINDILVDLLMKRQNIMSFKKEGDTDKFNELTLSKLLYTKYQEVVASIFDLLLNGKRSVMRQEILAQPISGAFRAVLTNNDSLDEDHILIGYELFATLFPNFEKKYGDDIDAINNELLRGQYLVLVNRAPTIGEKSIIAMKPIINKDKKARFVVGTNSIIFDGMAADTDGDALLIISLFSKEANHEMKELLPSINYIGGSDGKIRNKMPEDFIYAMSQIYKKNPDVRDQIKSIIKDGLRK